MKEWVNVLRNNLYNHLPWLDAGVRRMSKKPCPIIVQGIISTMESQKISLDEAYKTLRQDSYNNAKENLGPLRTAYRHLKKKTRS